MVVCSVYSSDTFDSDDVSEIIHLPDEFISSMRNINLYATLT